MSQSNGHATEPETDRLAAAFSPCPNDTFVFHAWAAGLLTGAPALDVTYADIDRTNDLAARGSHDLLKVSFAALPYLLDSYALLPCGGALGRGCGPLVLTRSEAAAPGVLTGATVAVPAERSTAYLLFRLWAGQCVPRGVGAVTVMPFHRIMPAVASGEVDAGLVIHEARFTYHHHGLHALADLGEWWEHTTGLPIPLGAIVARRTLDVGRLAEAVRESVRYARTHPDASRAYVCAHAQEMDHDVVDHHIALYVNAFTENLGEEGFAAVRVLMTHASAAGLVPPVDDAALR